MSPQPTVRIQGQDSFLLRTRDVELAVTRTGGMLGPVTFFPRDEQPIRPYAVAPWAEESVPADVPPMLRALRGDWFCSAFGENGEPHAGQRLPPHGETANRDWQEIGRGETTEGCWLRLGVAMPLQGGVCEATTALLSNQSIVYQRHDLRGLTGPVNPGHHATLAFPDEEGTARLSFSSLLHAQTYFEPTALPKDRGYSWLKPDADIADLRDVPCIDGSSTDLTRYPARRGFEDLAILCADPAQEFAWSAVTCPEQRYVWFALRDPKQLAATLLWFSNGGRHFAPWNGRHINVLGVEDITAFFHVGAAASCRENFLSARGIQTCLHSDARGRLSISYIQGVAHIPPDFDCVADIEGHWRDNNIVLRAESGAAVAVRCHLDFLRMGTLPGLEP
ncbi:hypothetical protein [Steroidobacter sp.]|uniref:hypothetical protein n=1 Tax=Steroidobacter sp. TaxID=1978227 RepID=UPI001A42206B|nr:hypothetical protein [Steroidobacter sp.]MBL8270756.1 hypothetical protein [Steroidobacter sp.]